MRELPSKRRLTIRHGDVFRHALAGAGGWGDPAVDNGRRRQRFFTAAARRGEPVLRNGSGHLDAHTDSYGYDPNDKYNAATQFTYEEPAVQV